MSEEDCFQYEIYSDLVPECETRTDDNLVNMEDVCFAWLFALIIHTQTHTHSYCSYFPSREASSPSNLG